MVGDGNLNQVCKKIDEFLSPFRKIIYFARL